MLPIAPRQPRLLHRKSQVLALRDEPHTLDRINVTSAFQGTPENGLMIITVRCDVNDPIRTFAQAPGCKRQSDNFFGGSAERFGSFRLEKALTARADARWEQFWKINDKRPEAANDKEAPHGCESQQPFAAFYLREDKQV
jgi:hypothetical protein